MMSRPARIAALVGCLFSFLAPAALRADATADARRAIQAVYAQMNAALARKDLAASFRHLTDDHVSIDEHGNRKSAEDLRRELQQLLPVVRSYQGRSVIQKITVQGNRATVVVQESGRMVVRDPSTDRQAIMAGNNTSRELWVKQKGRWMLKTSNLLKRTMTVNGKRLPQ